MNYKKIISYSVLALLTLGASQNVSAAPVNTEQSEARIQFTIDPTDVPGVQVPDVDENGNPTDFNDYDPDNPTDGVVTDNSGPLSLDYVTNLDFGDRTIRSQESYFSTTDVPFVQVTDNRGTAAGWNLTAQLSAFTINSGAVTTLQGASIALNNGQVASPYGTIAPPTAAQVITLAADGASAPVVTAGTGTGYSTWVVEWADSGRNDGSNENVVLTVPANAQTVGNHTATITWVLSDTP